MMRLSGNGITLSEALRKRGASLAMPCGGRRDCGKCLLWAKGALEEPSAREAAFLAKHQNENPPIRGFRPRLACFAVMLGDCEVLLPQGEMHVEMNSMQRPLPEYDGAEKHALGIAVDIGTTTIAARLYDLPSGKLLAERGERNQQIAFGADVLNRIAYADARGIAPLTESISTQLRKIIFSLTDTFSRMVITGNTTMLHFAAGLNPHGIGQAPFTPESLFGAEFSILHDSVKAYFPCCISSYVGADISCGILATDLCAGGNKLMVDIGTNGEMALFAGGRLFCCATAAGPAFEGAEIERGMEAAAGAICRVYLSDGGIRYETLGDVPARGICGTGLISALRVMLETGVLDETGMMEAEKFPIGDSGVYITSRDVRQLQLAKAAIAAGIDSLLRAANVSAGDIGALLLAGGFGKLCPEDAAAIGLIPPALESKARAVGNTALEGAARLLFSRGERDIAREIASRAEEVGLASSPFFTEKYMEHMLFPEAK